MMGTHTGNVITLANSIIGVSVLAMPFCFKQCGIILSILMLLFSNIITRLACHYLMKSAILEKRKNFEMLAFRAFGPTGKLIVELCIIGFMLGTCVAYFVIMGDLGPGIVGPMFGFEHPTALRPSVLIGTGVFVVLPLGLLKNVDSLSAVCAATVAFYFCLVLKVMGEALDHLVSLDWMDKVYFWRPAGILQCIPIFSMALFCQTQLFEIFDSLPSTPLDRMNGVVKSALNMVTLFYISVGFFGYVAYCDQAFTGNLMMNFSPTITSEVIKIGFLLSVAVSFPLVIFPCRASIYSLCFSKGYEHAQTGSAHIPETRFQCITFVIVTASLVIGLLIPNIEVVLGLVGSTIGVFICVIIPAVIFISLTIKNNNERLVAKILVFVGLIIMILGTYANLYATEEAVSGPERNLGVQVKKNDAPSLPKILENVKIKDETLKNIKNVDELAALPELKPEAKKEVAINIKPLIDSGNQDTLDKLNEPKEKNKHIEPLVVKDAKKEPPVPEEPQPIIVKKPDPALPVAPEEAKFSKVEPSLAFKNSVAEEAQKDLDAKQELQEEQPKPEKPVANVPEKAPLPEDKVAKKVEYKVMSAADQIQESEKLEKPLKNEPVINKDSNNLSEIGMNQVPRANAKPIENNKLKEKLIEKIIEHEEAQKKLNEEGVKLLNELKDAVKNESNSLKLVNVKTGVVTDLNAGQLAKKKLEEKAVSGNHSVEKSILSQNIAQGIPLPLAVKGKLPIDHKEKEGNNYKENEIVDKPAIGRDILGGVKELREKRDVDAVSKAESVPPVISEGILVPGSESTPDTSVKKVSQSQTTTELKGEVVKEVHNDTHHNDATLAKLKSHLENCNKNGSNRMSNKADAIIKDEKTMDELIKSPSYLSDPKSVLNESPKLLAGEVEKGNIPEMPKKRDLKSLSSEDLVEGKPRNS